MVACELLPSEVTATFVAELAGVPHATPWDDPYTGAKLFSLAPADIWCVALTILIAVPDETPFALVAVIPICPNSVGLSPSTPAGAVLYLLPTTPADTELEITTRSMPMVPALASSSRTVVV